jgi:hypothetical protein
MIDENKRVAVFDKSSGECNYCGKELALYNRDRQSRGAWEVEHRVPRAKDGTDHLNNLVAACWGCNLDKGTKTARTHHRAVAGDRAARTSRRRWRTAGNAVLPGLAVAGLAWAYLDATGPTEEQKQLMTPEERQRLFWKMLLIPVGAGLAAVALIVMIGEMGRKA